MYTKTHVLQKTHQATPHTVLQSPALTHLHTHSLVSALIIERPRKTVHIGLE